MLLTALCLCADAQSFWENTDGPYGVNLWSFLITEDGTYYGGAGDGTLYRKLPNSRQWKNVWYEYGTVLAMIEKDGVLYVSNSGSVVISDDNGDSWNVMKTGLPEDSEVRGFTVNALGDLFAATSAGIYKVVPTATPYVFNWQLKPYVSNYGSFIFSICTTPQGVMYAGTGRGLYRSVDNGDTWQLSAMAETANPTLCVISNAKGDVYAGMGEGAYINYIDDGKPDAWEPVAADVVAGRQVRRISVLDGDQVYMSVSNDGVYYSENNRDWERVVEGSSHGGTQYDPVEDRIVTSTLDGVWASPNAKPFAFSKIGIPQDIGFITSQHSTVSAIAYNNRLFQSPDQGATWETIISNGEGTITSQDAKDNGDQFVAMWGGLMGAPWVQAYRYIDFEQRWAWWSIGFDPSVTDIADILVTSKDSIYVATDQGLYYINSKTYESGRIMKIAPNVSLVSLEEDQVGNLYAGTNTGLYVSQDNGLTWPIHTLAGTAITTLTLSNEGEVYLATDEGVYYQASLHGEPTLLDIPAERPMFLDVAVDPQGHVYAVTRENIYYAEDKDATWERQVEGLEGYEYHQLRTVDNVVYVSTSVGLYKHSFAQRAIITLSGIGSFEYTGRGRTATAQTTPAGLPVEIVYNGLAEAPVGGGNYLVTARVNNGTYAGEATGRIKIGKAPATITLKGLGNRNYTGDPLPVTVTTVPAGLPVIVTYNHKADVPLEIGEYYVVATIDHPSYKGEATGDLIVRDAVLGVEDPHNKLVSVYPVPSRGALTIESKQGKMRSIVLYDVMGQVVDQREFTTPVGAQTFDVTHYAPGVLLVQITTDKHARIVKRAQVIH